jgi:hypothetical protein
MPSSEQPRVEATPPSAAAEAARYALLRRLAPSMRHHLVVNLQPIGMIYEVMERRLRMPVPDLAHVHESANKINGFARAALGSCLDVVGWLAPDDTVPTTVHETVRECVSLLATSLSFRGFALRNEVQEMPRQVRRSSLRALLTSALLQKTDHTRPGADLRLTAGEEAGGVVLSIAAVGTDGDKGFATEPGYRKLEWSDLQALAADEGARVSGDATRTDLHLPWLPAA